MMKYIKPYEITPEQEKTLKKIALQEAKKQKENPENIFWYEERKIKVAQKVGE